MASNIISPVEIKQDGLQPVSGIVTALPISKEEGLTNGGSLNLRVDIVVTGVTQVGTITAKLQHKSPNGSYSDLAGANASATITAAGTVSLRQNVEIAADQPNMPIKSMIRVVLTTTNAGDALTVSNIWLQQAR
jgi:hypothetical protein